MGKLDQFPSKDEMLQGFVTHVVSEAKLAWDKGEQFIFSIHFDTEGVLLQGQLRYLLKNLPIRGFAPECLKFVESIKKAVQAEFNKCPVDGIQAENAIKVVAFSLSGAEKTDKAYYKPWSTPEELKQRFIHSSGVMTFNHEVDERLVYPHSQSTISSYDFGGPLSARHYPTDSSNFRGEQTKCTSQLYTCFRQSLRDKEFLQGSDCKWPSQMMKHLKVWDDMCTSTDILPLLDAGVEVYHMTGGYMEFGREANFKNYHILHQAAYDSDNKLTWVPKKILQFRENSSAKYSNMMNDKSISKDKKPIRAYLGGIAIGAHSACLVDNLWDHIRCYAYSNEKFLHNRKQNCFKARIDEMMNDGELKFYDLDTETVVNNKVVGFDYLKAVQVVREKLRRHDDTRWEDLKPNNTPGVIGLYCNETESMSLLMMRKFNEEASSSIKQRLTQRELSHVEREVAKRKQTEGAFCPNYKDVDDDECPPGYDPDKKPLYAERHEVNLDHLADACMDAAEGKEKDIARVPREIALHELRGIDRNGKLALKIWSDMRAVYDDVAKLDKTEGRVTRVKAIQDAIAEAVPVLINDPGFANANEGVLDAAPYIVTFEPCDLKNTDDLKRIEIAVKGIYQELGLYDFLIDKREHLVDGSSEDLNWLLQFVDDMGVKTLEDLFFPDTLSEKKVLKCTYSQFQCFEYRINEYKVMQAFQDQGKSIAVETARSFIQNAKNLLADTLGQPHDPEQEIEYRLNIIAETEESRMTAKPVVKISTVVKISSEPEKDETLVETQMQKTAVLEVSNTEQAVLEVSNKEQAVLEVSDTERKKESDGNSDAIQGGAMPVRTVTQDTVKEEEVLSDSSQESLCVKDMLCFSLIIKMYQNRPNDKDFYKKFLNHVTVEVDDHSGDIQEGQHKVRVKFVGHEDKIQGMGGKYIRKWGVFNFIYRILHYFSPEGYPDYYDFSEESSDNIMGLQNIDVVLAHLGTDGVQAMKDVLASLEATSEFHVHMSNIAKRYESESIISSEYVGESAPPASVVMISEGAVESPLDRDHASERW